MIEQIEQLMINKEYVKAASLIEKELSKSFDFSDERERNNYNRLHELRTGIEESIGVLVGEEINSEDRMRSTHQQATRPKIDVKNSFSKMTLLEAFSQIISQKNTLLFEKEFDAYISILDTKKISEEVAAECSYPQQEKLKRLQIGDRFSTKTKIDRPCYSVIGFNNTDQSDMTFVTKGFVEIIDDIYEEKHERIGIILPLQEDSTNGEYRKIYFYFIIITLLMKILQNKEQNFQPLFYFIFQNDLGRELFEKTVLKIRKTEDKTPAAIPLSREVRLKELAEKCMTQDPEYVERLKSVLNVIDEEDVPILLLGESGVGKSFLAKIIHDSSNRDKAPFEEQNCGSLAEDQLNQTLWGWERGGFTGAVNAYKGKVKKADKGTLFLDEIDRTKHGTRNALITFIEKKEYLVLGGKTEKADVRLIFGSNKDLKDLVKRGQFEEDFYYRMSERIIHIPPLRDRVNDIDLIITNTLDILNEKKNCIITIDKKEREFLKSYSWPGNVRELVRYIKQRFLDAHAEDQTSITLAQMQEAPFENLSVAKEEDYEKLVEILRQLLTDWDGTKGSFLDEIIAPILAKIYMDDTHKHMNKTKKWEGAMEVLGISGSKYNTSSLAKTYEKFPSVKENLGF